MANPAKLPEPAPEPNEKGYWGVKDLNAKGGSRPHEVADGTVYHLTADKHFMMPAAHAAVFLVDPAFHVIDDGNVKQNTLPGSEVSQAGGTRMVLEPGQCIAKFEELGVASLLARAVRLPGGENFTSKTKHSVLVEFLTDTALQIARESDEAIAGEVEEMGAEAAGKMLGT